MPQSRIQFHHKSTLCFISYAAMAAGIVDEVGIERATISRSASIPCFAFPYVSEEAEIQIQPEAHVS